MLLIQNPRPSTSDSESAGVGLRVRWLRTFLRLTYKMSRRRQRPQERGFGEGRGGCGEGQRHPQQASSPLYIGISRDFGEGGEGETRKIFFSLTGLPRKQGMQILVYFKLISHKACKKKSGESLGLVRFLCFMMFLTSSE